MKYISTRNKNIDFSFKDIFLRGLAPDGGLFVPKSLKKYDLGELKDGEVRFKVDCISVCGSDIHSSFDKVLP